MTTEKPPIDRLLEHYGAHQVPHSRGWRKMRCPFHNDRSPSASVNTTIQRFKCYVCSVNEDAYGIVMWKGDASDFLSAMSNVQDFWHEPTYAELLQSMQKRVHDYVVADKGTAKEALDKLVVDWTEVFEDDGKL